MNKTRARELCEIGDRLFSARSGLMELWQDIADNFYPERADFTTKRSLGDNFADHLMSSYPVLARRTLADQFGSMLRPRQKLWAALKASNEALNEDTVAKQWLERTSEITRKFMYEPPAQFVRATKEGDHDFATFGQAALEVTMRQDMSGLLYRCYHLRDTAWCEDAEGKIEAVHRSCKLTAKYLCYKFPKTVSKQVEEAKKKEPYKEFECRHIVIPSEDYDYTGEKKFPKQRFPFVSIYLDKDNDTILEEVGRRRLGYVIPRWQTVSGSQYAHSPATIISIPDARLIQQMTVALLEAGEKAVTPPMVATQEAVRSDLDLHAGGVTWVDSQYDEKLGEALRPLTQDFSGIRYGLEMVQDVREMIKEAFYLNKINLPEIGKDMTAFEVQERVKEYIRAALPLFEPMEVEYNGGLCEETFALLMDNFAFGPPDEMPEVLRGQDVKFQFESPLQATADRAKLEAFRQAIDITAAAMQLDPAAVDELNLKKAYREALDGAQVPADWKHDPEYVEQLNAYRAEQEKLAKAGMMAEQVAGIADVAGSAAAGFSKAAVPA